VTHVRVNKSGHLLIRVNGVYFLSMKDDQLMTLGLGFLSNFVIYLIPPRYMCKVDNFFFKTATSLFGRCWNFPIFSFALMYLN
jgi:hypothetical protein